MRKHLTQGMCTVVKAAAARGQSSEDLLQQIAQEELHAPPEPPASAWVLEGPLAESASALLSVQDHQLPMHAEKIKFYTGKCVLCAQRFVGAGHVKTHWRIGHTAAWNSSHQAAESLAGSMSAVFRSPCQFCDSQAKDSKAHSRKCPSFFQVAALRHLRRHNVQASCYVYSQKAAPKQDKLNPQYKTYVAPIQKVLHGRLTSGNTQAPAGSADHASLSTSSLSMSVPKDKQDGTMKCFFKSAKGKAHSREVSAPAPPPAGPWQCRVMLRNPHSLCYINASFLALTHGIMVSSTTTAHQ